MNESKKDIKPEEQTDEEVGVQLPFNRLVTSMITIIVTGLIPDIFLAWCFIWLISITPQSLMFMLAWFLGAPLVFWFLYFVYLGMTVLVTHGFLAYYDSKSKAEPAILKRQFKDKSHPDYIKLHYYHMRGAIVKYSLWFTQKCPIPSLVTRVLNFYGHNTIGKRVLYDNCFPGLEFTDVKDDAVLEIGSSLSTHVVESLYGNLIISKITVGNGAVAGVNSIVGPGIKLENGYHLGDNCMSFQNWPLVKSNDSMFFNGSPAKLSNLDVMFADGPLKQQYHDVTRA